MAIQTKTFPKTGDSICIVGAGIAGIYMAYLLKKQGINKITILEKSDRIGGKCYTKIFNRVPHDCGGSMFDKKSYKRLIELIQQHSLDTIVPHKPEKNTCLYKGEIYSSDEIILDIKHEKRQNPIIKHWKKMKFYLSCQKYIKLHKKIFTDQEYIYRTQPKLDLINMSFYEFLKKNKLLNLANFFRYIFTIQYTYLEKVPALYGLIWCSPELIKEIVNSMIHKKPFTYRLKNGFQPLVKKIAEISEATILREFKINSIERKDKITVIGEYQSIITTLSFDFLILACGMKNALDFLDSTEEEKTIFSKLEYTYPVMTIFKTKENTCRLTGANNIWFDAVFPGQSPYKGTAELVKEQAKNFNIEAINDQGEKERVYLTYESAEHNGIRKTKAQSQDELKNDLIKKGFAEPELLIQCHWEYFPIFKQEEINKGYPWKIINMQGMNKTWYIGDSVCFESIRDVMNYNCMLVDGIKLGAQL